MKLTTKRNRASPGRQLYLLCSTPRVGSSLLAEGLTATGVAGRPNEYFDSHVENELGWREQLSIRYDADYVDRIRDYATTPNGVCGIKLHWHQKPSFSAKLNAKHGATSSTDESFMRLLNRDFKSSNFIWLRRRNVVRQAISYHVAARTGQWRSYSDNAGFQANISELDYDREAIHWLVAKFREFESGWESFFRSQRIDPLVIFYEDFVEAYRETIVRVVEFLDVPSPDLKSIRPPQLKRQATGLSHGWEESYRAEMVGACAEVSEESGPQ